MSDQTTTTVLTDAFDFTEVSRVVRECLEALNDLQDVRPPSPRGSAPGSGEMSRDLLNLADALTMAGALVRNEYWHWKGGISS